MKKLVCLLSAFVLCAGICFSDSVKDDWKEIGKSGKEALDAAGKFFSDAGKKIGSIAAEEYNNLNNFNAYGTWTHSGKKTTTSITFKKDGKMEIVQKSGIETDVYSGDFSYNLKIVSFKINEQKHKDWMIINNGDREVEDSKWILTVSVSDDSHIKIMSADIPAEKDGEDFSKPVIFDKQ